jgi:C-terminal processing protease CtpA/Prc
VEVDREHQNRIKLSLASLEFACCIIPQLHGLDPMRLRFRFLTAIVVMTAAIASLGARSGDEISRLRSDALTAGQIDNLVLLGKVWGFAKYHHPAMTSGHVDADSELLRILPSVLKAHGRNAAANTISAWLAELGGPDPCSPCVVMPESTQLQPDLDWIRDERTLGRALSTELLRIYSNRRAESSQYYVTLAAGVGNPVFRNEKEYAQETLPGPDLRLLALYRFWNIIEYWSPYRNLIKEDRDAVLREFLPRLWMAAGEDEYRLAMMALIARVKDGHANLWNSLSVRPPRGSYRLPVNVRFIEGRTVVTGFSDESLGPLTGLRVGDVIVSIGGARVDSLITAWAPYYAASNQAARLRDIALSLTQGPAGRVSVKGERAGATFEVQPERIPIETLDPKAGRTNDLPGQTFQRLTDDVAYLKLSSVSAAQASEYIRKASGSKVLVIDIRNYPSEFVVFALGSHLVSKETEFARFTVGNPANPGTFLWTRPVALLPAPPMYSGSVVILVDESSQSQAEYTAMAFRSAPNSLVVGSTTAGADGNVSRIGLPGGLRTLISGIGVFYPDRRPTQQVGVVPDLVVQPTIAGIREGRDEVLEAAVSRALGRDFRLPRRLLP